VTFEANDNYSIRFEMKKKHYSHITTPAILVRIRQCLNTMFPYMVCPLSSRIVDPGLMTSLMTSSRIIILITVGLNISEMTPDSVMVLMYSQYELAYGWLGSIVARAFDSRSIGREFNSRPVHCRTATLCKLFTSMCLCHQAV